MTFTSGKGVRGKAWYTAQPAQTLLLLMAIMCAQSLQSCLTLCNSLRTVACQAPLFMGFSQQETGEACHFLLLGNLLNSEIEPTSPASPALQTDSLLLNHWEAPSLVATFI